MHLYLYKNPTIMPSPSTAPLINNPHLSVSAPLPSATPGSEHSASGGVLGEEKISIAHELGKIQFFKIIATYPNYIQLNLPSPTPLFSESPEEGADLDFRDLSEVIITQHFLTGALIKEVMSFNTKAELPSFVRSQVRSLFSMSLTFQAIGVLRSILYDHANDPLCFENPVWRERVLEMYFPFLFYLVDEVSKESPWWIGYTSQAMTYSYFARMQQEQYLPTKKEFYACFIFLLQGLSTEALGFWLKHDTKKHMMAIFLLLKDCFDSFSMVGSLGLPSLILRRIQKASSTYHSSLWTSSPVIFRSTTKNSMRRPQTACLFSCTLSRS